MAPFATFLWAFSCAMSATAAADVTFPVVVEVDIIFPRNETYAPTPVFPLVFAIQNLAAASAIGPLDITWTLSKHGSELPEETLPIGGQYKVDETNSTDPAYINLWTEELNSAGTYQLYWWFNYYQCLGPKDDPGTRSNNVGNNFTFTIDPGAQQPDLSAVLDACPTQNATIVIDEIWPANAGADYESCGAVSGSDPSLANPCAVKLDSAAASSIVAEVTASACAASPPALTSGCETPTETSSGSRTLVWSGLGMFTGPLLAGVLLLVLQ